MYLFEEQDDSYSCGAYAFRNACALLGIKKTINECKIICNTISYKQSFRKHLRPSKLLKNPISSIRSFLDAPGTSETDLVKAVKKIKLKHEYLESEDEQESYEFMLFHAKVEQPVIFAVNYSMEPNDSGHWVTCGGIFQDHFVILDSAPLAGKILQLQNWKKLKRRLLWYEEDEGYFEFIGIAVKR